MAVVVNTPSREVMDGGTKAWSASVGKEEVAAPTATVSTVAGETIPVGARSQEAGIATSKVKDVGGAPRAESQVHLQGTRY